MPYSILVVEDEESIREMLIDLLTDEGYTTYSARNGRDALDVIRVLPTAPDLITLDLMMPVMNGWEFCEHRLVTPSLATIPVIVLSAVAHSTPFAAFAVTTVLSKPVSIDTLLEVVQYYCPS